MDDVQASADRAEWVYGEVAWTLNAFVTEMWEGRFQADALTRAVRGLLRRDNVLMTANSNVSPQSESFEIPVTRGSPSARDGQGQVIDGTATFHNNHVYQVDSIAPNGDVTLVNPHHSFGMVNGLDEDRFTITAEQFQDLFLGVSIDSTG